MQPASPAPGPPAPAATVRRRFGRLAATVLLGLGLAGCATLPPAAFEGTGPRLEPERFFAGHTRSTGVFEDRAGARPRRRFTTDCVGRRQGDTLELAQTFTYPDEGSTQRRRWRIRRLDAHRYKATASDVVGTAHGEAYGNAFHWTYVVALKPGNPLFNVRLEQWMYLQPDGRTLLNRGTVRKFGLTVAQVAEEFRRD